MVDDAFVPSNITRTSNVITVFFWLFIPVTIVVGKCCFFAFIRVFIAFVVLVVINVMLAIFAFVTIKVFVVTAFSDGLAFGAVVLTVILRFNAIFMGCGRGL